MKQKTIGLGAGGHALVLLDAIDRQGKFDVIGLLDPLQQLHGTKLNGVLILGDDVLLADLIPQHNGELTSGFVGLGGNFDYRVREKLVKVLAENGLDVISIIDNTSIVSNSAEIGVGASILNRAIVNARAKIGNYTILNTSCIVEHECMIGDYTHIAPGATLGAQVEIGARSFIGLNATVLPCVKVGSNAIVGAGAVVTRNVAPNTTVVGVPAQTKD